MKTPVRPRYLPPPYQDAAESGRLILRDGTTAQIRPARPKDCEALRAFFERLSPESRRRRFFSVSPPRPELLTTLCDDSDPQSALTLVVIRAEEGESRIVATGSYLAKNDSTAEVAFAVDDALHGKGLGTLLLERLALLAVRNGFTRFWAVTHADNQAMRDVFRESGFTVEERLEGGEIEVDLAVVPSETSVARLEMRDRVATAASLRPFFQPKSVAVVGASRDPSSIGYRILEALVLNRFQGPVYPINPKATVVGCFRAYPSVRELPEPVDLAVVAVPRDAVMGVVDDCAARGVRALVIITAGFAEVERRGARTPEKPGGEGTGLRHADDRPQLHGAAQHGPRRAAQRLLFPGVPPARPGRHVVPKRSARPGDPGGRQPLRTWIVHVRQRREQGRRLRQRPAAILGRGHRHRRDSALPGIVRQPEAVCPDRPTGQPAQTDRGDQERAHESRGTRGRVAHRRPGRQRGGCGRPLPPYRSHPRRDAGRNVRPRRGPGKPALAPRPPSRHRHQRRRAGYPVCRRVRSGRPDHPGTLATRQDPGWRPYFPQRPVSATPSI